VEKCGQSSKFDQLISLYILLKLRLPPLSQIVAMLKTTNFLSLQLMVKLNVLLQGIKTYWFYTPIEI
jgi:hypothetical protein